MSASERWTVIATALESYCRECLDEEYATLCRRALATLSEIPGIDLAGGQAEVWAAGVAQCVCRYNFIFTKSHPFHRTIADIAGWFGVSPGASTRRAAQIWDWLDLDAGRREFQSRAVRHAGDVMAAFRRIGGESEAGEVILADCARHNLPLLFQLGGGDRATTRFIDDYRPVRREFEALEASYRQRGPRGELRRRLRRLIEIDPDFLDSYGLLANCEDQRGRHREAEELRVEAARRADQLLAGVGPGGLNSLCADNQHLVHALFNSAMTHWIELRYDAASEAFRRLIELVEPPLEEHRYCLLATLERLHPAEFNQRFRATGRFGPEIKTWFQLRARRYPADFPPEAPPPASP